MPQVNQPEVLIANAAQRFNDRGELTDETSRELIRKLLAELVAWTRRLQG
jgi:chromate reductase